MRGRRRQFPGLALFSSWERHHYKTKGLRLYVLALWCLGRVWGRFKTIRSVALVARRSCVSTDGDPLLAATSFAVVVFPPSTRRTSAITCLRPLLSRLLLRVRRTVSVPGVEARCGGFCWNPGQRPHAEGRHFSGKRTVEGAASTVASWPLWTS